MKTFEVTFTTQTTVLMEAKDAAEARECMRQRMRGAIPHCNTYDIDAEEVQVEPQDYHRVLRP